MFALSALMAILAVAPAPATPSVSRFSENGTLATINPPHGWSQQVVPDFPELHVTNSYANSNAPSQRIVLGSIDALGNKSLSSVVTSITAALSGKPHVNIISSQSAPLCSGAASGWILRYEEAGWDVVETVLVGRLHGSAAVYLRNAGDPEDPNALNAIESLCLVPFPR